MLGLKRGTVALFDNEAEWETEAKSTIALLEKNLGGIAVGFEHIGSTSIRSIKAKPIVDIAVAVHSFGEVIKKRNNQPLLKNFRKFNKIY